MRRKRKTQNATELYEFLIQRVNRSTNWGKEAEKALLNYKKAKNTNVLSLLKSLVVELQTDNLADVCALDDEFYKRNVKDQCVCGRHISKEVYLMNYKPGTLVQENIISVISTGKTMKGTRDYIPIGSSCHDLLPYVLDDLGEPRLRKKIEHGRKEKEKKLEDEILDISLELRETLEKKGFDIEQLQKAIALEHAQALIDGDESGVKFDIDCGTNRNTYNWFREGIKAKDIENKTVRGIWYKLNNAAHLVTEDELAVVMAYSHEFRPRNINTLLAGVKDDLFYLANLPEDHPIIKKYGKLNINKNYVHPKTAYRSRKKIKKRKIFQVLDQDKITRVEAMGIHRHFPDIVDTRIAINRELTQRYSRRDKKIAERYGGGRHWHQVIEEMRPVFEEVKDELAADYEKFQKAIGDYVLTRGEYLAAKEFLKRSRIGKDNARKNYLRNFTIQEFQEIAPLIVTVGRKIRYAQRKYKETGDSELRNNTIKKKYILLEDLKDNFEGITGIKEDIDTVMDTLLNTGFIESRSARNFLNKNETEIRDMYENGLLAVNYLKQGKTECTLKRQYDNVRFGLVEVNEDTKAKLEDIAGFIENPFVEYSGPVSAKKMRSMKYISRKGKCDLERMYGNVRILKDKIEYDSADKKSFQENREFLEKQGNVLYLEEGKYYDLMDEHIYNPVRLKVSSDRPFSSFWNKPDDEYGISSYDIGKMEKAVRNIKEGIELKGEDLQRLKDLSYEDLKKVGIQKNIRIYNLRDKEFDKIFISKGLKKNLEEIYEKVR